MTSDSEQTDILIVGAGPAGLMAAAVAATAGAGVTLLDEQDWAGGRLALQTQPLQGPESIYRGLNGVEFCRRLADDAASAGAEILLRSTVTGLRSLSALPHRFELALSSDEGASACIRAKSVVLAPGSREPWPEFAGSTLPGVMLSGDAQAMLNVKGVLPGKRALMVGSDNAGLLIAANLLDAGVEVAALIDESRTIVGREFNAAPLRRAGVELLTSSSLVTAHGEDAVTAVTIDTAGTKRSFEVDTVCLAGPRTPESRLAAMAGCPLLDLPALGGSVPAHDRRMAAPVAGLYVCGDASGVESGAVALESGRLAGLWAAAELGRAHPRANTLVKLARGRLGYLRRGRRGLARREAKALASRRPR